MHREQVVGHHPCKLAARALVVAAGGGIGLEHPRIGLGLVMEHERADKLVGKLLRDGAALARLERLVRSDWDRLCGGGLRLCRRWRGPLRRGQRGEATTGEKQDLHTHRSHLHCIR